MGGKSESNRQDVVVGPCDSEHRFEEVGHKPGHNGLKLKGTNLCLDANDYNKATFSSCHYGQTQKWKVDESNIWVKVRHAWGDNGRQRFFERCLDSKPEAPVVVSVQPCEATHERGVSWTRINSREPPEA